MLMVGFPASTAGRNNLEKLVKRIAISLKTLAALQLIAGFAAGLALTLMVRREIFEAVGEEIMMDGNIIRIEAIMCMFLVMVTGAFGIAGLRWGWILSFITASVVLVMALLMGPGTVAVTRWSFLGLMGFSLVNWAEAVVYYFHDLYT
jgi:hypothetical protein